MTKRTMLFIVLSAILVVCSCSVKTEHHKAGTFPDMILENATYTFGQPDKKPLILTANSITIWEDSKTELENVSFIQKNNNGDVELSGSCDSAVSYNNNDVELNGNVRIEKKSDSAVIEADNVRWDDKKQKITSEKTVKVSYDNKTELTVKGFSAYLDSNIYEFSEIVEGRIRNE